MPALPAPTFTDVEALDLLRRYLRVSERFDADTAELDRYAERLVFRLNVGDHPAAASAEDLEVIRPHLADIAAQSGLFAGELVDAIANARKLAGEAAAPAFDLDVLGGMPADATANASTVPALWGTPEHMLATLGGRYAFTFGNDGAGKTTAALRIALGALGLDGFEFLLGHPVTPMPDGDGVIYIATDGPEEARANLGRMVTADGTPAREVAGSRLFLLPRVPAEVAAQEGALLALVEAFENRGGQRFGLVIVDNAMRTFGNVTDPNVGGFAARSLSTVTSSGRAVLVIAQTVKGQEAAKLEDAYGGADFTSGCGTAVSLYHTKSQPGGAGRLRHMKGYGSNPTKPSHYWTESTTGAMALGDPPTGSPERTIEDRAKLAEGLAKCGEWLNAREVGERFDIATRTATRRLEALEDQRLAESRPREGKGGGTEYRGVSA